LALTEAQKRESYRRMVRIRRVEAEAAQLYTAGNILGADLRALTVELMGKVTGISKGRGDSMHLADKSVGIIGGSAIVVVGIPRVTGYGLLANVRCSPHKKSAPFGLPAISRYSSP
jgi:TPP-dependent pyruvate/acetoin dehydrogenase alpha subunit